MLYSRQYFIAGKIVVVTFFILKIFGLWPYKYEFSKRPIEFDFLSIIFSVVVPLFVIFAYFYIGSHLFTDSLKSKELPAIFASFPLQLIVLSYSYLVIISYLILCVGQHLQGKRKEIAYVKCKKVVNCIREFRTECVDIKKYLNKFFLRTLVYDVFHFSLFYYNLSSSSLVVMSQPFLSIFVYLPIYIVRLNTNAFFGGILFFNVIYKQLNQRLKKIFSRLDALHVRADVFRIINVEFEKTSLLYFELATAIRAFGSIFSFQIILWIAAQLIVLTTQFFYQYIAIVNLSVKRESYFVGTNLSMLGAIIMTMYELIATASACNSLKNEVCNEYQFDLSY